MCNVCISWYIHLRYALSLCLFLLWSFKLSIFLRVAPQMLQSTVWTFPCWFLMCLLQLLLSEKPRWQTGQLNVPAIQYTVTVAIEAYKCFIGINNHTYPEPFIRVMMFDMNYACSSCGLSNLQHSWELHHKYCSQQFAHLHVDFWCVFYNVPFVKNIGCTQGRQTSLQ